MVRALKLVTFICVAATVRFLNWHKKLLSSVIHDSLDLFETGNKILFEFFNINTKEVAFYNFKAFFDSLVWWDSQVLNLFIVNFENRGIYFVFYIFAFVRSDSVENFIQSYWNDTLVDSVSNHTVWLS